MSLGLFQSVCREGSKKTVEETKQSLREKESELVRLKADLEMAKLVAEERKKVPCGQTPQLASLGLLKNQNFA